MICWSIWLERNRIEHGQSPQDSGLIWQGAIRLLQEFQDAAMRCNVQSGTIVDTLASIWQPPPYGFVKINCDAAWLPSSKQVGLGLLQETQKPPPYGFVKINCNAAWLPSSKQVGLGLLQEKKVRLFFPEQSTLITQSLVLIAEAEAVWWAVKTAHEKHLTRIEIETDSFVLYQSLFNGKPLHQISSMWQDMKDLTSTFECCHWTFVRRGGNAIAHGIARWALGDIVNSVVDGLVHHESSRCILTDTS
ncbi:hypothetical protein CTI12_AA292670 [Artemisia annua]|uniref:RNase H type-1 domain-containing protein n=1 Tax=Artemisia annua TaxID=35608 RepID=A0A2U1N8V4_ARTAN|nr:hypothetical protein CTI12_AA292670 [Artemisia annua]